MTKTKIRNDKLYKKKMYNNELYDKKICDDAPPDHDNQHNNKHNKSMKLWQKVAIGMIFGIIFGFIGGEHVLFLKPVGLMYVNLLKMIVVPIVFFAILYGMTNMEDVESFGRIGARAMSLYVASTIVAVTIGIVFGKFFEPGAGFKMNFNNLSTSSTSSSINNSSKTSHIPIATQSSSNANFDAKINTDVGVMTVLPKTKSATDIIVNIIPSNIVEAMSTGNTLQIVVFAFIFGLAMIFAGEKGKDARNGIISITHVIFKLVELVISATPYGVFAIMACTIGEYGVGLIISLGKLVCVIMGGFAFQYLTFGILLMLFKINPYTFFKKMANVQMLALATSSSKATLMYAINDIHKHCGVSPKIANFVLPLGATINMTATAIYLGICALFFAQIFNMELSIDKYVMIALTSTLGSIGAAGFPSGGVLMLGMVLTSIGLPIDGIPLLMGIDRFLDMFRTMINITGDCVVTVIVDKIEDKHKRA